MRLHAYLRSLAQADSSLQGHLSHYEGPTDSAARQWWQSIPSDGAASVRTILENEMLNGEAIRLDGALRLSPK